ncbi:LCP family protein [Nonomuraea sp. NEAU-A123]|uniref:LCP family protein n=1 Tax=Nonomuraea sp. NEAU-A123 TaxID=2839649 RepID=UPI001BE3F136|nr:LCP family protein [Nonomuraea sp. NEAU-A123]MBT2231848.1 LCP family protein [Nonomuraea sp. NEAU-A123]
MDDLKMLQDLGRELEHQPPATLMRQRQRLLQARPRRRRVTWLMTGLVAVATMAAVAVPTLLLSGRQTVSPPTGARPANVSGVVNVLLVGSDSRAGTGRLGNGARSDTLMLLHLPADRKNVTVVAFPRDSMVRIPACGSQPARKDMINSAFSMGGLACSVKTVESLTKVRVDHMMELGFSGVEDVVDALGGVEVTLPEAVDDKSAKLKLSAGKQVLNGKQALAYLRLRHYGDGSDIQRIKRQQVLMTSMLKKAQQRLKDPAALRVFLTTASKSIKTDAEFDLDTMLGIAGTLDKSKVRFVMVPWKPDPNDQNRLVWKQPDADQLFAALR